MAQPTNTQLFALAQAPPRSLRVGEGTYALEKVFKHDFFAATALYAKLDGAGFPRVVVKFGRTQPFCGLPMCWYGQWLRRHEEAIYAALAGVEGIPRWAGRVGDASYAIQYIHAAPLDHLDAPPPGLFDKLARIFRQMHARGVAYCDANKRSNILVDRQGQPWLVDFQISLRARTGWPAPLRGLIAAVIRYAQRADVYHLYKHKRRMARSELTPEEELLSRRRGLLHTIHRKATDPWRALRRRFLRKQTREGRLLSPSARLEDHHQPEKATWREDEGKSPSRPD